MQANEVIQKCCDSENLTPWVRNSPGLGGREERTRRAASLELGKSLRNDTIATFDAARYRCDKYVVRSYTSF